MTIRRSTLAVWPDLLANLALLVWVVLTPYLAWHTSVHGFVLAEGTLSEADRVLAERFLVATVASFVVLPAVTLAAEWHQQRSGTSSGTH